jgi:hypothetical protein
MLTLELSLISQVAVKPKTGVAKWLFKVRFRWSSGVVFPSGAYAAGAFEPVRNFDASTGEKFVQSADKASGMPLWVIEVIDGDPAARVRAVKVKVAAQVQPIVPTGSPGSPFVPVEFIGLTVTPYVNQAGRLAYSLKATGIRAPGRGRPGQDMREAAA